jgi:hypothetical protein
MGNGALSARTRASHLSSRPPNSDFFRNRGWRDPNAELGASTLVGPVDVTAGSSARGSNLTSLGKVLPERLLELESDSHLPFPSCKNLQHLAKPGSVRAGICSWRNPVDRCRIIAIEQIEELKVGGKLGPLSEIEPFRNPEVHVNEERGRKVIAALREI